VDPWGYCTRLPDLRVDRLALPHLYLLTCLPSRRSRAGEGEKGDGDRYTPTTTA
jgi:hypothetical protein